MGRSDGAAAVPWRNVATHHRCLKTYKKDNNFHIPKNNFHIPKTIGADPEFGRTMNTLSNLCVKQSQRLLFCASVILYLWYFQDGKIMRGQVQQTKNKELPIKKQDKPQKPKKTMKRKKNKIREKPWKLT